MLVKTVSRGVRLEKSLWDLVKAADPGLTYSEIIKRALLEKYNFILECDEIEPEPILRDIHFYIDHKLGS